MNWVAVELNFPKIEKLKSERFVIMDETKQNPDHINMLCIQQRRAYNIANCNKMLKGSTQCPNIMQYLRDYFVNRIKYFCLVLYTPVQPHIQFAKICVWSFLSLLVSAGIVKINICVGCSENI